MHTEIKSFTSSVEQKRTEEYEEYPVIILISFFSQITIIFYNMQTNKKK